MYMLPPVITTLEEINVIYFMTISRNLKPLLLNYSHNNGVKTETSSSVSFLLSPFTVYLVIVWQTILKR
jgi:hypothetical protein